MSPPSLRSEFIDLYLELMAEHYPDRAVSRQTVEAAVREVREDGSVIFSDTGEQNLDPNTVEFIKLGATIVAGILQVGAGMLSIGGASIVAWTAWQKKKADEAAAEAAKQLDANTAEAKQMVQTLVVVIQKDADGKARRLALRLKQRP
jgi:hypothetical protein